MRRIGWVAAIATIWVLLWDRFALANVAAGVLVGVLVLVAFPLPVVDRAVQFHALGLVRLATSVVIELVISNLNMSWLIINPRQRFTSEFVECRMYTDSPPLLSTIANIIALSPGMMAVEAARAPNVMIVHGLNLTPDQVRRRVARLERRVIAALGTADDRQALSR